MTGAQGETISAAPWLSCRVLQELPLKRTADVACCVSLGHRFTQHTGTGSWISNGGLFSVRRVRFASATFPSESDPKGRHTEVCTHSTACHCRCVFFSFVIGVGSVNGGPFYWSRGCCLACHPVLSLCEWLATNAKHYLTTVATVGDSWR